MNSIEYYISCEIFRQITEALNYLHSLKPEPLIHRDLKPENILIGMSGNKRICKIADFGLSKFIENKPGYHTKGPGTIGYIAPEVDRHYTRYDTSADVYSLGMIGLEIFSFGSSSKYLIQLNTNIFFLVLFHFRDKIKELYENSGFFGKIQNCMEIISSKLTNFNRNERISCHQMLEEMKDWTLDREFITTEDNFNYYSKLFNENKLEFFSDILE